MKTIHIKCLQLRIKKYHFIIIFRLERILTRLAPIDIIDTILQMAYIGNKVLLKISNTQFHFPNSTSRN